VNIKTRDTHKTAKRRIFNQYEYIKKNLYEKLHFYLTVKCDSIKTAQHT